MGVCKTDFRFRLKKPTRQTHVHVRTAVLTYEILYDHVAINYYFLYVVELVPVFGSQSTYTVCGYLLVVGTR